MAVAGLQMYLCGDQVRSCLGGVEIVSVQGEQERRCPTADAPGAVECLAGRDWRTGSGKPAWRAEQRSRQGQEQICCAGVCDLCWGVGLQTNGCPQRAGSGLARGGLAARQGDEDAQTVESHQ